MISSDEIRTKLNILAHAGMNDVYITDSVHIAHAKKKNRMRRAMHKSSKGKPTMGTEVQLSLFN